MLTPCILTLSFKMDCKSRRATWESSTKANRGCYRTQSARVVRKPEQRMVQCFLPFLTCVLSLEECAAQEAGSFLKEPTAPPLQSIVLL